MVHRSEHVPSATLTVIIAIAAVVVLLAGSVPVDLFVSHPVVAKSIICLLAVFMINRIGVTNPPTTIATMLLGILIVIANPVIPFELTPPHWRVLCLGSALVFAVAAISSLLYAARVRKRSRLAFDKRIARTGFRN